MSGKSSYTPYARRRLSRGAWLVERIRSHAAAIAGDRPVHDVALELHSRAEVGDVYCLDIPGPERGYAVARPVDGELQLHVDNGSEADYVALFAAIAASSGGATFYVHSEAITEAMAEAIGSHGEDYRIHVLYTPQDANETTTTPPQAPQSDDGSGDGDENTTTPPQAQETGAQTVADPEEVVETEDPAEVDDELEELLLKELPLSEYAKLKRPKLTKLAAERGIDVTPEQKPDDIRLALLRFDLVEAAELEGDDEEE